MLYVIIIAVATAIFWFIAKYFYDKLGKQNLATVSELNDKMSKIMPLLDTLINSNIPVQNSYTPNHSLDSDRVYDDSIDQKILGDKYPASEIRTYPVLIDTDDNND